VIVVIARTPWDWNGTRVEFVFQTNGGIMGVGTAAATHRGFRAFAIVLGL
jgi:hypothetical protein